MTMYEDFADTWRIKWNWYVCYTDCKAPRNKGFYHSRFVHYNTNKTQPIVLGDVMSPIIVLENYRK